MNTRYGRSDWIRTSGLLVPNQALYQTEPHPVFHALELYHICGIMSIFFLQLLSFFCLPNYGDGRCRFAARRSRRVRFSHTDKGQMFFIFPIGRQARSLFHATVRLKILHRFANISFSK